MMANGADVVPRGKVFHELNIRREPRASEHPLEEIMTKEGGIRSTICEGGFERVDVIDAFPGIRSFPEQILIDVRGRRSVGINSANAREDSLEQRAFAAHGQRWRHPWLQDRVAFDNLASIHVEARPVQRMRHLAN